MTEPRTTKKNGRRRPEKKAPEQQPELDQVFTDPRQTIQHVSRFSLAGDDGQTAPGVHPITTRQLQALLAQVEQSMTEAAVARQRERTAQMAIAWLLKNPGSAPPAWIEEWLPEL